NVTRFSSTFKIQSTEGVVSGTKNSSGVPQNVDINFSTCIPGDLSSFAGANANYVATIQTAQGSFRDTGLTRAQVGGTTPGAEGFWEPFETSNGVVPICNQNSQVN